MICDKCGRDMRAIGIIELAPTMRLVENAIIEVNECLHCEGRMQFYRASDDKIHASRELMKELGKKK